MALPKAIQKQADEMKAFDEAQAAANAPVVPAAEPPETPPATTEAPVATATTTVSPPEPQRDDSVWEQKYRTLQGMFSRETQTLRNQLQETMGEVNNLKQTLAATKKTPDKRTPLVTPADTEAFGSDLVDMARRVAREEFGDREEAYQREIADLRQQVTQQVGEVKLTQAQSAETAFFNTLSTALPNWRDMQNTDACQAWLGSRVPGTQFVWNDVLTDAAQKFDAPRAIEVFQNFLATQPRPTPPADPARPTRARSELSRQVTPAKSNASSTSAPSEKRYYSPADYEAESRQIVKLAKAGRHDEAKAIERELDAALVDGRLRP